MMFALSKIKSVSVFATLSLGLTLGFLPDRSFAAGGSGGFNVTATLVASGDLASSGSAFCQTTPALAFGALVTVVCATGETVSIAAPAKTVPGTPIHGGAYRVILARTFAPGLPDFYDNFSGYGMASSWRVIQVGDRSYYELLMGW